MRPLLLATAAAAMMAATPALAAPVPQAKVQQGLLRGTAADGIQRFFGIPFAKPPVGPLRWRAPEAPTAWEGVRDASAFGPACFQSRPPSSVTAPMSEDCLTLNVWTPDKRTGRLPVMVWIYGGGFLFGSNREPHYDGTALARKGVVLVTINYRVGPLGFLAHPDLTAEAPYKASGNYGILDQIAALRWIKANIAAFGGDPDNVTIFGESAGSTAISILQASRLAKGLFAKVIGESTSQFDPDGGLLGRKDMRGAEAYGKAFGDKLGAPTAATLRALPAEAIVKDFAFFWPTERDGHVLPDLVYTIFARGQQNDVPTLVGSNSDEGAEIKKDWVTREAMGAADYDRLYAGARDPLRQSSTDAVQWQMRSWARLQARTGKAKSWLYWFDQPWPGRKQDGAFHGGEIVYVFKTLDTQRQPWQPEDRKLSELMANYWVSFAKDGDPNGPGLPRWTPWSDAEAKVMLLSPRPGMIPLPRADAQAALDRYFDKRR